MHSEFFRGLFTGMEIMLATWLVIKVISKFFPNDPEDKYGSSDE